LAAAPLPVDVVELSGLEQPQNSVTSTPNANGIKARRSMENESIS
jgi:hypothetical protein